MRTQAITRAGATVTETYVYDAMNRLKTAARAGGGSPYFQRYCYDRWGNRALVAGVSSMPIGTDAVTPQISDVSCPEANPPLEMAALFGNNRWTGGTHDSAGNMTLDGRSALTYDGENRMVQSERTVAGTVYREKQAYDGAGRRVKRERLVGGTVTGTTVYVYNAGGKLAAEYGAVGSLIGTHWLTADHLGSTRLVTDASGSVVSGEGQRDFLPFGQEWPGEQAGSIAQRFTGKERDAETGLDYFGARYMSAAQGRFTSPDPFSIMQEAGSRDELDGYLAEPQRWNKYAYSLNNPLAYVDPDGRNPILMQWMQRLSPYADKAAAAAQRWGGQASQAASRYGQQAYVWATQFFNSPTGQEVTAAAAEMATGSQLPYGFTNAGQFQQFGKAISSGLREVAGEGAQAFLGGSAITGKSFSTGAAFDIGRTSDFDIAVVGGNLLGKAKELGIELRGKARVRAHWILKA